MNNFHVQKVAAGSRDHAGLVLGVLRTGICGGALVVLAATI